MRVAVLGTRGVPAGYSGIERHVEEIGARLAERGHEVVVFGRDPAAPRVHRGISSRPLPSLRTKHLETISHTLLATGRALRGFDVVHFHAVGPALLSPVPRTLSRAAVVVTVHGRDGERAKWGSLARGVLRAGERVSAVVPHRTIVVSRALQRHYAQHYHRQTVHVPNGVALPTYAGDPRSTLARWSLDPGGYALFVGRLVPEKGLHLLLEAWRRVGSDHRLVVVGGSAHTDGYVAALQRAAAADPRVVLTGPVYGEAVDHLYAGAALFVSAALLEAAPLTVLEAAVRGLPLVTSDVDGHREDVAGDQPGWRFAPPGDATALAAALAGVLADLPAERAAAACTGRRVAREHDWDGIADATLATYGEALQRAGGR